MSEEEKKIAVMWCEKHRKVTLLGTPCCPGGVEVGHIWYRKEGTKK